MIREVNRMMDNRNLDELLGSKSTPEVARDLLGMYLEYSTPEGIVGGYIVDTEAYLGPDDEAAHSFGMRRTPRVAAMYEKPGTIYLYTMHTHRILNIITQPEGIPQGVMIRAIEPVTGIKKISALPRIGIPNKGEWTAMPLRFVVSGNPYISLQKKNQIDEDWGWRK